MNKYSTIAWTLFVAAAVLIIVSVADRLVKRTISNTTVINTVEETANAECDEYDMSKVLITVISGQVNHDRVVLARRTWLKQVDPANVLIVTDKDDSNIGGFVVEGSFGSHDKADIKFPAALAEMYRVNQQNNYKFEYFFMGDDDTFLVVRNLAKFLHKLDVRTHAIYGQKCSDCCYCGGAGIVISAPLLQRLVPVLDICVSKYLQVADRMLSLCLKGELGVSYIDSIEFGSGRPWSYIFDKAYENDKPNGMGFIVSAHYVRGKEVEELYSVDQLFLKPHRLPQCRDINTLLM